MPGTSLFSWPEESRVTTQGISADKSGILVCFADFEVGESFSGDELLEV